MQISPTVLYWDCIRGTLLGIPTHLPRDLGEIDIFCDVGETLEASHLRGGQEGECGQSDVCVLKVLLDLLAVLWQRKKIKLHIGGASSIRGCHEKTLGFCLSATLTFVTFSSSSRFTTSYRWIVFHRGLSSSQLL